jgi:AraC-like DNA-binding protein
MASTLDPMRPGNTTGPSGDGRPVRIDISGTSDADAVSEIGALYDGQGWVAQSTGPPFRYRFSAVGTADVTLRRSLVVGSLRGTVPPPQDYVVNWITSGRGVPDVVGDRVPLQLGVPTLAPTGRASVFDYADHDQRIVHLSRRLVHEVADELFHTGAVTSLDLDHLRVLDPIAVAAWQNDLTLLTRELRSGGVDTLLWHTLSRATAASFLRMYPPAVADLPPAVLLPRRARLRAAVEYLHEHVAEPISVSDVASAAGLSVRATQETFQRHLGRTPMGYLQRVRLERVREELLRADPSVTSVQSVARRWGFSHLGRFSAAYRTAFGEYPRVTLAR